MPPPRASRRSSRHSLHEIARRLGRGADPAAAGRNVGHDAALRAQHRAGTDRDMIGDADLPAHHDEIARPSTLPEMPACPAIRQCRPMRDVVRDLHEIVDLGALADDGVAGRAAVDRGVGADLDVVLNDDAAGLRDFLMALRGDGR